MTAAGDKKENTNNPHIPQPWKFFPCMNDGKLWPRFGITHPANQNGIGICTNHFKLENGKYSPYKIDKHILIQVVADITDFDHKNDRVLQDYSLNEPYLTHKRVKTDETD